jgi:hypothetical protein
MCSGFVVLLPVVGASGFMSADDVDGGPLKVPPRVGMIFAIGFGAVLVAAGVVFLYLSDQVVHGWWQGTLEAFGVGFIVGGLVDVVGISGLNQVMRADNEQRQAEQERAAREQQKVRDEQAALHRRRAEEILARLPPGDVERMLRVLRDDTIDPGDRVAVLQRLSWKERDALLNRLEEVDPEQYEALWPQVYLVRP